MAPIREGDCFFLVWCEPGARNGAAWGDFTPNKQHVTRELALEEAQRLARQHRGRRFFVVKAIAFAKSPLDVETIALDEREELPF